MDIAAMLLRAKEESRIIGFSPWRSADGAVWGYVREVTSRSATFDLIDPFGQPDGTETYPFHWISYFDFDADYSHRLERLRPFKPTLDASEAYVTDRSEVRRLLASCAEARSVCSLRLRSESCTRHAVILSCDNGWIEFLNIDEAGRMDREIWRISAIKAVRCGTRTEEAEQFLRDNPP
jgi:hypothetical protein